MAGLDATTTVAQWVTEHPRTASLFEELQIDYCCGGGNTLAEACSKKGLDAGALVARLAEAVSAPNDEPGQDWSEKPLAGLCDHIEQTHHAFLRRQLPRLTELVDKVAQVHGQHHPELVAIRTVFGGLRAELEPHMFKEEQILFPAIRALEASDECPRFPFGTVANPIRMMEHEHDEVGTALQRIRELLSDYQVPSDACNTWRVMLDGLQHLEADTHQHVHKENNILFPRAQRLEASRSSIA